MKRVKGVFGLLLAFLIGCTLGLPVASAAGVNLGQLRAEVIKILDAVGVTTGGTYTPVISGLTNVVITSVATNNVLQYDGSDWTNRSSLAIPAGTGTFSNLQRGSGSPEGAVTGSIGDVYQRTNGSTGTTLYVKESGSATNTGWVAVAAGGSQTPWASAIDADGYALTDIPDITFRDGSGTETISAPGLYLVSTASDLSIESTAGSVNLDSSGETAIGVNTGTVLIGRSGQTAKIAGVTSATVTAPIQRWSSGAGKTLTSAECRGQVYVVSGEETIPFTLPAAPTVGDHVTFLLAASTPLKITAGTDDSITLTSTTLSTNTDGYIYTTRNSSSVHLVWDSGTSNWYGVDVVGTWAFDSTTSAGYAYTPTPWTTFTATGSWTNVTYTACKYQQVGNLMRINYRLTVTGTPADAGQVYLDMPSGFTVDEAGIGSPYNGYVGGGSMTNTGSGAVYTVLWHYLTSVPDKFYGYDTAVPHASVTKSSPAAVGSGFELDTYVTVPVD